MPRPEFAALGNGIFKKRQENTCFLWVYNIGPLDRFDDGQPDYVGRLKKSFKAGVPLIPALKQFCDKEKPCEIYNFSIKEGSLDCIGHPTLFSSLFFERIIEELGLSSFFRLQMF